MRRNLAVRAAPVLAAALATVAPAGAGEAAQVPDPAAARLERVRDSLGRQLELASGDGFYLMLDTTSSRLDLMLRGVVLQRYAVREIELGRPRIAFVGVGRGGGRPDTIQTGGRIDPARERERIEIRPDPAQPEREPPIPPDPATLYPAPERFLVRFAGGTSLEIVAAGDGDRSGVLARVWQRVARRMADAASAVLNPGAPRIRLILEPDQVATLYRALPPDLMLLVVWERVEA